MNTGYTAFGRSWIKDWFAKTLAGRIYEAHYRPSMTKVLLSLFTIFFPWS